MKIIICKQNLRILVIVILFVKLVKLINPILFLTVSVLRMVMKTVRSRFEFGR